MAIGIAVLTAATISLGRLLTGPLAGSVGGLDLDVVRHLAADRTPFVNQVTGVGGVIAGTVAVSVLWAGAVVVTAWRTRRWTVPVFLVFAIGGEKLTYLLASTVVGRSRPPVESLGHVYATNSFPSGHVAAAITLYGGAAVAAFWCRADSAPSRRLRVGAATVVAAITVLVAFSRVSRGHHFPSDVVWGAVLASSG
ncbi:MAG: phosphatase PAP2 family protein [Acidimicrobiia bacterium]